jgi:hypothetical protein
VCREEEAVATGIKGVKAALVVASASSAAIVCCLALKFRWIGRRDVEAVSGAAWDPKKDRTRVVAGAVPCLEQKPHQLRTKEVRLHPMRPERIA